MISINKLRSEIKVSISLYLYCVIYIIFTVDFNIPGAYKSLFLC